MGHDGSIVSSPRMKQTRSDSHIQTSNIDKDGDSACPCSGAGSISRYLRGRQAGERESRHIGHVETALRRKRHLHDRRISHVVRNAVRRRPASSRTKREFRLSPVVSRRTSR